LDEKDFDRTYIDKCSGKNTDRPQLQAMLDNLRPGDSITCHSLDRLARNTFDLLDLVKKITEKGCSIVFLKENLHFEPGKDNPISTLMMEILASIAQFERSLIRARQAEGIAIAKAKHKFKGSTEKLSSDAAKEMKELVSSKKISIKDAMKRYNISRASVYNYLKRDDKDEKKDIK
jgi:DNA invertase Pin-like site-specific DNA recombinase